MKKNIPWLDLLRVVACFMVVLSHSCDFYVGKFDDDRAEFLSGTVWGSLVRACVPLFIMISGVLLIPVRDTMSVFYRKRLSKVVIPLVIWSLISPLLYWAYQAIDPSTALYNIVTFPLNFNYTTTPLWYLYMLVGIYLILPIVSPWVQQASRSEVRTFLYIWGFTMIIPYCQLLLPFAGYEGNYGNTGLFGVCDWNPFGTFYYFSGFLGYVILAYYMVKYPANMSWRKTLVINIPLFVAGYLITQLSFVEIQKFFPGDFAYLELAWYFTGINVLMMTYAVFSIFQKIEIRSERTMLWLNRIAALTFGIYLCHFIVVQMSYDLIYNYLNIAPYFKIPIAAILAFTVSGLVVWVLSKLPFKKYLIG